MHEQKKEKPGFARRVEKKEKNNIVFTFVVPNKITSFVPTYSVFRKDAVTFTWPM
jgi:hypothetical protein